MNNNKKTPKNRKTSQMWWCISVIPTLRRLKQEECIFEASLKFILI
jgi:hypothetical protein